MRIALIDLLKKHVPYCDITLMTPFPYLDSHAYKDGAVVKCSRRNPVKAVGMILRSICWALSYRVFGKHLNILTKELNIYRGSDLIIDMSGDGITEEYGLKCLVSHLIPIIISKLLCKPVFICAQTIGPLSKTGFLCRYLMKSVDNITAREMLTYKYLSQLGVNKSLSLTADFAFLMKPAPKERALEILRSEGVPGDKPMIGFSVSCLPGNVHGYMCSKKTNDYETAVAAVLDWAVEAGLQPVIISHSTGPTDKYDDRRYAERVARLTVNHSNIVVVKGDYSPEETKAVISMMEMFVGVRLHSCIAAVSTEVPVICIAYGPKAYGVMDSASQGRWVIDISNVDERSLVSLVKEGWDERDDTKRSLECSMPVVKNLVERNMDVILQLLQKGEHECS